LGRFQGRVNNYIVLVSEELSDRSVVESRVVIR